MVGIILEEQTMGTCLMVWVDWNADEWGWLRADRSSLVTVSNRLILEQVTSDRMHGPLGLRSGSGLSCEEVTVSFFIDGTAVEVFTSSGKAASTRMYWNAGDHGSSIQLYCASLGGNSSLSGSAWEMNSIWDSSNTVSHP